MKTFKKVLLIIFFVFVFIPCLFHMIIEIRMGINRSKEKKASQYIQAVIVKSLNDYYQEYGEYTIDLHVLFDKGYLDRWSYPNPFSETKETIHDEPYNMTHTMGNFTYLPVQENNKINEYYILIYGPRRKYLDVDGDGKGDYVTDIIKNGRLVLSYEWDEEITRITKLLHKNK
jgi:hypothetical protein